MYTLLVHNVHVALHRLGGVQADFAFSFINFFDGAQCSVVSLNVRL